MKKPNLSLCMIVKNETKVLQQCFDSLVKYIDYWVICDTGSTDGTQEMIQKYFEKKNIPGELHQHKWISFSYNRTLAFKAAYRKSKYVWVIDADDYLLDGKAIEYVKKYSGPGNVFLLNLLCGNHLFSRPQIFRNDLEWEYIGVLHEIPRCKTKKEIQVRLPYENATIKARTIGFRNENQDEKLASDVKNLLKGIEDEKCKKDSSLLSHYYYHLGITRRLQKEYKKAEECFLKVVECNEKDIFHYSSLLFLSFLSEERKKEYLYSAIRIDPENQEAYYYLGEIEQKKENYSEAIRLYQFARQKKMNVNFGDYRLSTFLLPFQLAICLNMNEEWNKSTEICRDLIDFLLSSNSSLEEKLQPVVIMKKNERKEKLELNLPEDDDFLFFPFSTFADEPEEKKEGTIKEFLSFASLKEKTCLAIDTQGRTYFEERKYTIMKFFPIDHIIEGIFVRKEFVRKFNFLSC